MNNSNHLVNSDNVGYASYLFEQEKNKGMLPGEVGAPKGIGETGLGRGGRGGTAGQTQEHKDLGKCSDLFPFPEGTLKGVFLTFQTGNWWQLFRLEE